MKMPGPYVPLDVNYDSDDDLIAAGESAEVLYLRSIAYCKRSYTNGFVADYQLSRFGLPNIKNRVGALVRVGLWVRDDDQNGHWIRSWSRWNESSEEQEAKKQRAKQRASKSRERAAHVQRTDDERAAPKTEKRREETRQVPTTSDIEPRDVEAPISQVVQAYVDGATTAGLPRPSERLRGKVGRDAKRLAAKESVPVPALIAAARSMGERGWDDIDRELQRIAVNGKPRPSTTDDRVAQAQAIANRYRTEQREVTA